MPDETAGAARVRCASLDNGGAKRWPRIQASTVPPTHQGAKPFYLSYAYEALARAEKLAGHTDLVAKYRAEATRLSEAVEDIDERELLINDLKTI